MAEKLDEPVSGKKKQGFNIKFLLFGLPIFIIQLVIVYLITINVLLDKMVQAGTYQDETKIDSTLLETGDPLDEKEEQKTFGQHIYTVQDIIVNPSGSAGDRYVMMELGFDVTTEENLRVLEKKGIILKDIVTAIVSSKKLEQLSAVDIREILKSEIIEVAKEYLPDVEINTIYYSKFVIN